MQDQYQHALRVLGLEPGATEQAIKDAHRDLVKVWHPDRFGSDPRLRAKAQDKLKEVNAAFEQVRGYRASDFKSATESGRPGNRGSDFSGSPAREPAHAKKSTAGDMLRLSVSAILIGFVGVGLFIWRSRSMLPPVPAPERIQTLAPVNSPQAPVTRQPVAPAILASSNATPEQPATGSLTVASRPLGARVSFDGRVVGETPITVTNVPPGEHQIELTLAGDAYQPWSSSVVVTRGREEKLLAVMTRTERPHR
jgi:PEGA domain/DnaJ domain